MNAYQLIKKKRDGAELFDNEMEYLISGFVDGSLPDYQAAAFLMAVYFRGLTPRELHTLIELMMKSGDVIDLSLIPDKKIDKHSTGGVGDKISLILAPLVATAGVPTPMISGRGLGHTGGTIDKLESIPGYRANLSIPEFKKQLQQHNLVIVGQSDRIAPADKKLYALRDVTATIESLPLITSSILSKKMAEGADGFVFDVKIGNGAFMAEETQAVKLANMLTENARRFGKSATAYITDMSQPLGLTIGNILEVKEALATLQGQGPKDLTRLTEQLGAETLLLAGKVDSLEKGRERIQELISNRAGYLKFIETIEAQGGKRIFMEEPDRLPTAPVKMDVRSTRRGFLQRIDTLDLGLMSVKLGAGRRHIDSEIDPTVGFVLHKKIGDRVEHDHILLTIHAASQADTDKLVSQIQKTFTISDQFIDPPELIKYRISDNPIYPWLVS
ncbi:MAG: thymidine phosphorylase [Candidatus Cloacimonetes bacterium 4572_55]|nr:MAG: thymidine phosphorylase [Candidatus Cloacimonetes bacterium 4572_55]